jgi:hypothetical protein
MSSNLIRITVPKKTKSINETINNNVDQVIQTQKKDIRKFIPPNSKSFKNDLKFKTKISRENIENDKNLLNISKNEVSKKLSFERTLQHQLSKPNLNQNKIPNGKFVNLKDSYKKSVTKLSSNTSRRDIEMKNQTNDSIHLEGSHSHILEKRMDIDRNFDSRAALSFIDSKHIDGRVSYRHNPEFINNLLTTGNLNEEADNSIDIDEFLSVAVQKVEESGRLNTTLPSITSKKEEEITFNSYLESLNEFNLRVNFESKPEFQTEEYRNLVTQLLKKDYSNVIIKNLIKDEESLEDCLINHKISERMRTRMVDWMIEVLTNYKCDEHTFFLAVNLMDRYFKSTQKSLNPNDLHGIGIAAMFMASKFYDVYPLRLKIVYEKIAHKKLSCEEIKNQETEIANALNYIIGKPTVWEFLNYFIDELFYSKENDYNLKSKVLKKYLEERKDEEKDIITDYPYELYTENMIKLLRLVVIYLSKMNCHDYNLIGKKPSLLASSTLFVALKICEQINKESYVNDYFFKKITEVSKKPQSEIIKCAQKILYNAQNFDTIFTGLDNLKKIHFNAIIEVKDTK